MCGITGFVGTRNDRALDRMTDALAHRGPDARGTFADDRVSLGHRRLSIVDLTGGQQPAFSSDGSLVVVFNGEIYNHPELKQRFEQLGRRYVSRSDTETILHAYAVYGTECVAHLDGMFAFVLYDRQRQLLFGARDRCGKKPLYYTTQVADSTAGHIEFAFASELKSLREHPALKNSWRVSQRGILDYLLNDYVVGAGSIYENVHKLGAGCAFTYGLSGSSRPGFRQWTYWDFEVQGDEAASESPTAVDEQSAGEQLLELLQKAVEKRLMADVPLGVLLSGGIDSSAVVAMLAELRSPAEIDTFSIGFDEPSFDESLYARQVAEHFGTRHHSRQFTANDLTAAIPHLASMLDEPFADPSMLPVSMLCRFAREHVTVALGGDGGDEIFAGYDPFRAVGPARLYGRLVPEVMHRAVLVPMAKWLPASASNMALQFRVSRFLRGAHVEPRLRPATWMGAFSLDQLRRLLPEWCDRMSPAEAYAPILAAYQHVPESAAESLSYSLDYFQRFYLVDDILVKADRASMLHGLELRSPFLDTALVDFANRLPSSLKLRGGVTKYLLKQALMSPRKHGGGSWLPRDIVERKKKGFGIPVARWIRQELRELFQETLVDHWPEQQLPMFNRWEIEHLLAEHVSTKANHYKELWALFMLAQWAQVH